MGQVERSSHFGSDAFPLENLRNIPKKSFEDNLISYLGEYRFSIPRYDYELYYLQDQSGIYHIVDPNDHEAMTIKALRSIEKQRSFWKNDRREVAEYDGLVSLEKQLSTIHEEALIVWTSPPGAREEGYGDYGFFFMGKVCAGEKNKSTKKITMTAFRIDNQTVDQCSKVISQLTGNDVFFQNLEECIASPKIIPSEKINEINFVLENIFHFTCDIEKEQLFQKTINILHPSIRSFIDIVYSGVSKEVIQQSFYAIENYVLQLRKAIKEQFLNTSHQFDISHDIVPFDTLVHYFGSYIPPAIGGSCGSTGAKSSNIFNNSLSSIVSLFFSEKSDNFICPSCNKESVPPIGDSCPKCGITKNQAKEKGYTTC